MLQQTKVETVRPYYDSWMDHFPTIPALAAASQDEVLRQWQGLGYYSRARNLHEAVQEVQVKYGGHVPENKKDVQSLKGVGDYTAGAILSLAYGQKEAAVDGNVLRIFARLYDIEENILSTPVKKKITALVEEELPDEAPGTFNEALMDLGAMVCIPKLPAVRTVLCKGSAWLTGLGKNVICPSGWSRRNRLSKKLPSLSSAMGTSGSSTAVRPRASWRRCGNFPMPWGRGKRASLQSVSSWRKKD